MVSAQQTLRLTFKWMGRELEMLGSGNGSTDLIHPLDKLFRRPTSLPRVKAVRTTK
jgi:hypothetical protein